MSWSHSCLCVCGSQGQQTRATTPIPRKCVRGCGKCRARSADNACVRLESHLRETEAEESDIHKDHFQGQILQQLLWTYTHVLKQVPQRPELKPLLCPVFKGLVQYAHLVNLDFSKDILDALGTLFNLLGSRDAPCCLQAAFAPLSG
ncbi:hypothetical protein HPB50_008822 [Hyalomma asiaticum]|uniref:Uncharacterized protein n=1 Tax=Hyalomma asiaticum TaxID=266040 RepID=A0ACB7TEC3_HYAAI|nr:hypothetical protein HPB50_008822 [Hyalomma asiaticum]